MYFRSEQKDVGAYTLHYLRPTSRPAGGEDSIPLTSSTHTRSGSVLSPKGKTYLTPTGETRRERTQGREVENPHVLFPRPPSVFVFV